MKPTPIRTNPDANHLAEPRFHSFPAPAGPFPGRQAAVKAAEALAREAAARLFPDRTTHRGQTLALVRPPAPPPKAAGAYRRTAEPTPPTPAEILETAWRKRVFETAWAWTERTEQRDGIDLQAGESRVWLPADALDLACLEGYAIREVQPFDGAGGVFPSDGEPEGFPRAELSTPQPQPSPEETVYA